MSERLDAGQTAALLKADPRLVHQLWEEGILQGVRDDGAWYTTRELLEGDIQLLTDAARANRLRQGDVAMPGPSAGGSDCAWLTVGWIDAALDDLRAG